MLAGSIMLKTQTVQIFSVGELMRHKKSPTILASEQALNLSHHFLAIC